MWRIGVCGWTVREMVLPLRFLTSRDCRVPTGLRCKSWSLSLDSASGGGSSSSKVVGAGTGVCSVWRGMG